jgi:hypothetical protein
MKYAALTAVAIFCAEALSMPIGEESTGKLESNVSIPFHRDKSHSIRSFQCTPASVMEMMRS